MAGQAATSAGGIARVLELLSLAEKHRTDLRNWEWYYLDGLCHRDLATLRGHQRSVMAAAWSPDGRQLASAGDQGVIHLWDANRGETLRTWRASLRAIRSIAWSPDGTRLATASLGWSRQGLGGWERQGSPGPDPRKISRIPRRDSRCRQSLQWLGVPMENNSLREARTPSFTFGTLQRARKSTFCPVKTADPQPRVESGRKATRLSPHRFDDPDLGHDDGQRDPTLRGHLNWANSIAWKPRGTELASASKDRTVKVWSATDGKELLAFAAIRKVFRPSRGVPTASTLQPPVMIGLSKFGRRPAARRLLLFGGTSSVWRLLRGARTASAWPRPRAI